MTDESNQSPTRRNLQTAFAGESMANRKYLYFAKLARELGDEEVAKVFEDTADAETGHAFAHLALLYPPKTMTVAGLLEAAVAGERYEHTTMYPGFEEVARREADAAAEAEFREQAEESREHEALFARTLETARRRFAHLTKVEKEHADRYQRLLDGRKASGPSA
ncbi:MAG: rubrerythrin family protein [Elusimicrobia bacterium]|nr:rubrerythrin family protein [Elusimicrobiota bacterium]